MKTAALKSNIESLLDSDLSDQELRRQLESLASEPAFSGLTWYWGPVLYERNKVMFRPFILSHFGRWRIEPFDKPHKLPSWKPVKWRGHIGQILDQWLKKADQTNDIELFKQLFEWKASPSGGWRIDQEMVVKQLAGRLKSASTPAARRMVLSKYDIWFTLNEADALTLYQIDPELTSGFILKHLPVQFSWWGGEKRKLWTELCDLARHNKDDDLYFTLYRRQIPLKIWENEIASLCDQIESPEVLVDALEKRHPQGWGLNLGAGFYTIVNKRGRDVFPYIYKYLKQVWPGYWMRSGYEKMLALAEQNQWWDFWATLMRVCARPDEYSQAVEALLQDASLDDAEIVHRLLMMAGVAREYNFPGLGLAQVKPLQDKTAVLMHQRFPELLHGVFKANIALTYGHNYKALIARMIEVDDEELIDFMASRAITRIRAWGDQKSVAVAETLAAYYENLRTDDAQFCRRACAVLGQIPAYAIWNYNFLIRQNRLACMMFERSGSFFLNDPQGVRDLVEAPEIHVQSLAYRVLGMNDPRAMKMAGENLDVVIGTLLRPLRRRTRLEAFGALLNAARCDPKYARRIHERARQALSLPAIRYPREQLIGLIGQLLNRHPSLRQPSEFAVVFERGVS